MSAKKEPRVRFTRNYSPERVAGLRALYENRSDDEAWLICALLDELEHVYQAILAPGYGFEAEMDRYYEFLDDEAQSDALVEANIQAAEALADELLVAKRRIATLQAMLSMREGVVLRSRGPRLDETARGVADFRAAARAHAATTGDDEP